MDLNVATAGTAVGREPTVRECPAFSGGQAPRMEANRTMIRLLAVSMLSLALAGCAQSKGALSRGASYPPSPVAITPVPSIYDTINPGVGGKALAQSAMKHSDDPQWTGQTQVSVAARPIPPGAPGANGTVATAPAVAPGSQQPTGLALGAPPYAHGRLLLLRRCRPQRRAQAMPAALAAAGVPGSYPAGDPRIVASGAMMNEPASIPVGASPTAIRPTAAMPADVAVSTPASAMPATLTAAPGASGTAPARRQNADPLLGPNPDLMPAMPDPAPVKTAARPSPAPSPAAAAPAGLEPGPALVPASGPALPDANPAEVPGGSPVSPGALVPAEPPVNLDRSTAASKPADGGLASADLPIEASTGVEFVAAGKPGWPASAASPSISPASDLRDSRVILTSGEGPSVPPPKRTASLKESGRALARVGNEVITQHDLTAAFLEEIEKYPDLRRAPPDPAAAAGLSREQAWDMLTAAKPCSLLIDRSVLAQEAKRHIKDKKMLELIYQDADRIFRENEVPSLMRKNHVDSEARLKERLTERGRSLEGMRLTFREVYLAESFRYQKVKDRLKVELPDLLKYYNDQLVYDHEFDRPAQITLAASWSSRSTDTRAEQRREKRPTRSWPRSSEAKISPRLRTTRAKARPARARKGA